MKVTVLSSKKEGKAICLLCETTLKEYVLSLDEKYKKYDVQRGIVKNIYLDKLSDTIFEKGHIPPIVLISPSVKDQLEKDKNIEIKSFNILDGLQRTFRIKRIWDSGGFIFRNEIDRSFSRSMLIKKFNQEMTSLDIDPSEIIGLAKKIQDCGIDQKIFESFFSENKIWIEIWGNLKRNQQINKMLTLNAGHKPMQKRHQLELLFLNLEQTLIDEGLGQSSKFQVVREKDVSVTMFQKNKVPFQFHLSILIASVISYVHGKVIIPGVSLVKDIQDQGTSIIEGDDELNIDELFNEQFYEPFISLLLELDKKNQDDENVLRWSARETVLPGIFAALGKVRIDQEASIEKSLNLFASIVKRSGKNFFNIKEFEEVRAKIPVQKVNVGRHLRELVFQGVLDVIANSRNEIKWINVSKKLIK